MISEFGKKFPFPHGSYILCSNHETPGKTLSEMYPYVLDVYHNDGNRYSYLFGSLDGIDDVFYTSVYLAIEVEVVRVVFHSNDSPSLVMYDKTTGQDWVFPHFFRVIE